MANLNISVQDGNNIIVEVTPTPRQTITLDRGVAGNGVESVSIVYVAPNYFLEFDYTNGSSQLVQLPSIVTGVSLFNGRAGSVVLLSSDVTSALGYTPPTPTGTGASGTWAISVSGNAATATNVPYSGLTGVVPTWNQSTTGNAATVTNGVYTTDIGTVTNTMLAGSIANGKLSNSTITINGTPVSLGGSISISTGVGSVGGTLPIVSSGGTTPVISITQANTSSDGYLSSTDWNTFNNKTSNLGTVTSVSAIAGTGILITGSPITTSGTFNITNSAPDQTVVIAAGTGISVSGTYPNFTVTNTASGGGTVTAVTGVAPVVSSGGATPAISMAAATTSVNGYLTSTDWNTFNSKQPAGTYVNSVSATSPITSSGGVTPTIAIPAATTSANGYLTSTDWNTFNNKVGTVTSSDGSIDVVTTGATVDLVVSAASPASTLLASIRNQTGATLTKGTVVYISGATGNKALVSKAIANSDATSAQTFGLITTDLANNANGYVTIIGALLNLNTSAFTEGVQLYLSSTVAGAYTATKQYAPQHLVYIGIVTRSHPTQGTIEVKIQNGYEMDELHDVFAQTPVNGNVLIWNATTQLWEAAGITAGTGVSVTNGAGSITVANTGVTSVTGTAPVVSSGGATPAISMAAATTSVNGYLTSTDWNTFNNKTSNVGTVTSVAATVPSFLSVTGSPITTTGTLAVTYSGVALPILNGGTGQTTQTAAFDALAPTTTKGDLIVSNGTDNVRLPVGTDTYSLVADSTQATGVRWSASAGAGVSQIIAGTNITISPVGGTGAVTINSSGGGGGAASGFEQTFLLMGA